MADYKTDLEIAREAKKEKIVNLATDKLSMDQETLFHLDIIRQRLVKKD